MTLHSLGRTHEMNILVYTSLSNVIVVEYKSITVFVIEYVNITSLLFAYSNETSFGVCCIPFFVFFFSPPPPPPSLSLSLSVSLIFHSFIHSFIHSLYQNGSQIHSHQSVMDVRRDFLYFVEDIIVELVVRSVLDEITHAIYTHLIISVCTSLDHCLYIRIYKSSFGVISLQ